MIETIVAAATISPEGEGANQDRVAVFRVGGASGGAGVVVCDGVGSYAGSGAVADEVAANASEHLATNGVDRGFWSLPEAMAARPLQAADGATTLIAVGADRTGLVGHAFVGNGSLIESVPYEPRPGLVRMSWIDLALPQISWDDGRPALRSFLPAPGDRLEASHGLRTTELDRPRLYLACSDGIATDEDRPGARSPEGVFWKQVPQALVYVVQVLERQWPSLLAEDEHGATVLLEQSLKGALSALLEEGTLDDDASVACVLLRPCSDGQASQPTTKDSP